MALNGSQADAAFTSGRVWSFAGREFDESRLELRVDGKLVELELKPLEILLQLLLRAGQVVTKDQLLDAVWPGLAVVEGSLTTAIYKLRHALEDHDCSIIVTVPRVGYRLAAPVLGEAGRKEPFISDISLQAGNPVPSREQWLLSRSLEVSPNSEVWLAEHPKTHELRVFKFASNAARLRALRREVTVFRFVRESIGERPEFIRIFEWNFERQPFFLESEYGGPDLVHWAESHGGLVNIPLKTRLQLFVSVARAVAVAHHAGVLHKDLKPANILVTPTKEGNDVVRVVDFGSASLVEPERLKALGITNLGFTQTGGSANPALTGTLLYLAPELFYGGTPSASTDVYALGVILYQLVIGDFRKPLATGWENVVADELLREDISQAVHGDPAKRLNDPAALADRVLRLEERRDELRRLQEERKREETRAHRRAEWRAQRPWIALAGLAILALIVVVFIVHRKLRAPGSLAPTPQQKTVAVLPFQNIGKNQSGDFLGLALPDEVATALSYSPSLSIRPFGATRKYTQPNLDPQRIGLEMGVSSIVSGRFLEGEGQLVLTLELLNVKSNRVIWQDTLHASVGDLVGLQRQITLTVREGLASALGSPEFTQGNAMHPKNAQAYELYLRSIASPNEGIPNKEAVSMLKKAMTLDPDYAPAWHALGMRYYYEYQYGAGGEAMLKQCQAAEQQALRLEPNFIAAGTFLAQTHVERGELAEAYQEASALLRQRPDSAEAHFAMAYTLRYAGLLKNAANECEKAWALDPHNQRWRSCENMFEQLGDFQRAMEFLHLDDPNNQWSKTHLIQFFVRDGKPKEAVEVGPAKIPGWESFTMLQDCAGHRPEGEIAALAAKVRPSEDSEMNYAFAAHLSYCGYTDASYRLLKLSIEGNHCSYPAMDTDPLFANLRAKPEFAELRSAGIACQQEFLAETRYTHPPGISSVQSSN